jgi:hypothetical protein
LARVGKLEKARKLECLGWLAEKARRDGLSVKLITSKKRLSCKIYSPH